MYALLLAVALGQNTSTSAPAATPVPSASPATLGVSTTAINLNPAQQQTVAVTGATPPLQIVLDRKLVTATADPNGTALTITAAQATGSATLHLIDATGASTDIAIRVAFNAGTIVGQTTLSVTGNPADPGWLAQEVADWVTRLTQALPGATVRIGAISPPAAPLLPDQSTQFVVPVQIDGNAQYFDQTGSTTVTVRNLRLKPPLPTLLFYDDDPEHITQDGVLFRGSLSVANSTRLYYYHDLTAEPRRLVVALRANSEDKTSLQLVAAVPSPGGVPDTGQTLTDAFLPIKMQNESVVLDLSPGEPYILADVPMTADQTAAGTADVRVLSGGPVELTVLAVSPGVDPRTLLDGPPLPDDTHHRSGVFAIAPGYGADTLTYSAGGEDATLYIPDATIGNVNPSSKGRDDGDYGVVHTIDLTLHNPGTVPAVAYFFFQPPGQIANGTFLIDGKIIDIGCVRLPVNYLVTTFNLLPGQTYHTTVQTMVNGGSYLPIEVGVTATPPVSTPPLGAPDGCFPK
ncbi:MAG: hypothetical protein WB609_00755 [Candidatus Cybelea sp.]